MIAGVLIGTPKFYENNKGMKVCRFPIGAQTPNDHPSPRLKHNYLHIVFGDQADEAMKILKPGHRVLAVSQMFGVKLYWVERKCENCGHEYKEQKSSFEFLPTTIVPLPKFSDDYEWLSIDESKRRKRKQDQGEHPFHIYMSGKL